MDKQLAKKMSGAYALMLTPYNEDLTVDYTAYERYVEWQADKCKHLFAVCGSSEMSKLTLDERVKLATLTVEKAAGKSFVVATGNMEPSWLAQVDEVKRMEATGVDGLVFITKGYGDNEDRLVAYLSELATYTKLPIMLYEFPGCSPHKISGNAYGRLVETGYFYGIKDTTCTMDGIKAKIAVQGESNVLQANIPFLFEAYKAGARGVMATPTTCGAHLFQKMWDEFSSGKVDEAEKTHQLICLLDGGIGDGFNATAKYIMKLQGCDMNPISRGASPLSAQKFQFLDTFYKWAKDYGMLY